jgi:PAS domain S-box-containing protein
MARLNRLVPILALKGRLSNRVESRAGLVAPYLITATIVAAGVGIRLLLAPWTAGAQFITFFPTVIVATLAFGPAAGAVSAFLAAAASLGLVAGAGVSIQEASSVGLFLLVAFLDVTIISMLLAANAALRDSVIRIEHLNAGLGVSEARFRNLLENAPDAMVIVDGQGAIVLVNGAAERLFGYRRTELLGQSVEMLMPPGFRDDHRGRVGAFVEKPNPRRMGYGRELFGLRKDGSEFPIETNLSLLSGGSGGLVASAIRDISARRDAEDRQALLIRELNHRVKNALASVQAIVSLTLTSTRNPEAFSVAMTARLGALSHSHDVLTRNNWTGAQIGDLVAEQLSPYGVQADGRFQTEGPSVTLTPNRAVTLGMVLGELATNAGKYGALSVDGGVVNVSWELRPTPGGLALALIWSEAGGPRVKPPKTRGFGTRLIQRSVTNGLMGSAQPDFQPAGFTCRIEFPLQESET